MQEFDVMEHKILSFVHGGAWYGGYIAHCNISILVFIEDNMTTQLYSQEIVDPYVLHHQSRLKNLPHLTLTIAPL